MGIMRATSLIFCGVSLTIGCISLVLAARRFHPARHALFGAASLVVCVYSILTLLEYDAVSFQQYDAIVRVQLWFTGGTFVLYTWFVRNLANGRGKIFAAVYSIGWAVLSVIRFFHPTYLIYASLHGLSSVVLPTGERISLLNAAPSLWYGVFFAFIVVFWAYLAVNGISMLARGNRRHGLLTLASLAASIAFIVNDILISVGAYRGVYTAEFGMSGFVILMGLALADDVVQKERIGRRLDRTSLILGGILNHTPALVLVLDGAGGIVIANRRVYETLGLPVPAAQHLPPEKLAADPAVRELVRAPAGGGDPFTLRLALRDGEHDFLTARFPVPDETGRLANTGVVATDITPLRKMEDDLRQSEKLRALGLLAGGVAHDFNNQLTTLLGYAELIQESARNVPELGEYARAITQAVERSRDMIGRLLAFARKEKKSAAPVPLDALLRDTIALLERTFKKKIEIRGEIEGTDLTVTGDRAQLENALLNLAFNARDAMPDGGRLSFRLRPVSLAADETAALHGGLKPGPFALIEVEDTGYGIQPNVLAHIFEPLFTTKPAGEGTGLGLPAVMETARAHGGTVAVDSRPDEGAIFRLYLPRSAGEADVEPAGPEPREEPAPGKTVWVVDDEELIRSMIRTMLTQERRSVRVFASGEECLAAIESLDRERPEAPQAVLLDMILPGIGSRGTFSRLRSVFPDLPVVLISGAATNDELKEFAAEGNVTFLGKPFRKAELLAALGSARSGSAGRIQ